MTRRYPGLLLGCSLNLLEPNALNLLFSSSIKSRNVLRTAVVFCLDSNRVEGLRGVLLRMPIMS